MFDFTKLASATKSFSLVLPETEQREPVLDPRRVGRFTASDMHKLMTNGRKSGTMGQFGQTYIEEVACAAMTGENKSVVRNAAMQWGIDHELEAIGKAEEKIGLRFEKTGDQQEFLLSEDGLYGGTPDGIVPNVTGIEAHCPNTINHLRYRGCNVAAKLKHENPQKYWQTQCLLTLTGFPVWYFISYDPRLPREDFRLHILRIEPNADDIAAMLERIYAADEIKRRIIETGII